MAADTVGIVDFNVYLPDGYESSDEIAARAGLTREVVEEKLGLLRKPRAAAGEHVSDMAVRAARPLLAGVPAEEIDAVVYFGSPHKDYPVWLAAPKIQHELGAHRAVAFEVSAVSAGLPIALDVTRSLLTSNPHLRTALLVGASKESSIIDYGNPRSRFMFNFADGAAAALLRRGHPRNAVLATAALTDGSFHDFVKMPAGGTDRPASRETVDDRLHFMDVSDPAEMKRRLDPVSADRFLHVARLAAERSGFTPADVRFVGMLHTKRSLFERVMDAFSIPRERRVYLEEQGHMSAIDPLVALAEGRRRGLLSSGDLVVLLSAGTGYTWAATALRWG